MNSTSRTGIVLLFLGFLGSWHTHLCSAVVHAQSLATYERLTPLGLERAWFAQVRFDPSRNRVDNWTLHNQELFSLSTGGTVQCLNAETGATRWVSQVTSSPYDVLGPAVNRTHVAVLSGSRLFILDREDGHLLWSREVSSAPAAAPALSVRHAFVALFDGRIEAYELNNKQADVWYFQSAGRQYQQPVVTGQVISWSTDRGYLYIAEVPRESPVRADRPSIRFRIETASEITAPPAEALPYLYVATNDGLVYCVNELSGKEKWRISTGYPVSSQPAVVGDRLYVASIEPALFAMDAATGELEWRVPGIAHFVAQGEKFVIAIDELDVLRIIDRTTGNQVGRLPLQPGTRGIVNSETDRIYLVHERGLVQSLRERGATEPTVYRVPREEEPEEPEETTPTLPEEEVFESPFPSTDDFDDEDDDADESPFDVFNPFLN